MAAMTPPNRASVGGLSVSSSPRLTVTPPKAPVVLPRPAAAPPPAATPPAPTYNTREQDEAEYYDERQRAEDEAKKALEGKEHATISNPLQQENDEYLALLKSRLGGLNSEEMLAAKEQGLVSLDQATAQNLERYGGIAGAAGVQGGARAALMGRALQENSQGRAQLERQLILDNLSAKDRASQAYGGALSGMTNTALGIETYNAGSHDADIAALLGLTQGNQAGVTGKVAATDSRRAGDDATQIARDAIRASAPASPTTATGTTGEVGRNIVEGQDKVSLDKIKRSVEDIRTKIAKSTEAGQVSGISEDLNTLMGPLREQIKAEYPDEPGVEKTRLMKEALRKILFDAGVINTQGAPRAGVSPMQLNFLNNPSLYTFEDA